MCVEAFSIQDLVFRTQSGLPSTAKHPSHALTFNPDIPFRCPAYKPATHFSPHLWPSNHHHSGPDVHTGARDPQLQRARKQMEWTWARPPWVSPLRFSRAKTDRSAIVPAQPTDLLNHTGLLTSPCILQLPHPQGPLQAPMRAWGGAHPQASGSTLSWALCTHRHGFILGPRPRGQGGDGD